MRHLSDASILSEATGEFLTGRRNKKGSEGQLQCARAHYTGIAKVKQLLTPGAHDAVP